MELDFNPNTTFFLQSPVEVPQTCSCEKNTGHTCGRQNEQAKWLAFKILRASSLTSWICGDLSRKLNALNGTLGKVSATKWQKGGGGLRQCQPNLLIARVEFADAEATDLAGLHFWGCSSWRGGAALPAGLQHRAQRSHVQLGRRGSACAG